MLKGDVVKFNVMRGFVGIGTIFVSALIVVVLAISGVVLLPSGQVGTSEMVPQGINPAMPEPPWQGFEFQEMTIPYLRDREYASELSELRQINSNSSYTTYLTSYDSDGLQVNGLLTIPNGSPSTGSGSTSWPAVVFVHGYIPPTLYKTTVNYQSYVDYLARRGLVVFKIDLRGHDQSKGEASGAYYSGDYIVDVLNARSALGNHPDVDARRVGLWGHSMAGNVVFRSMVVDQSIDRGVIWAGAVYTYEDLAEYGIDDNSYRPPGEGSERRRKRDELFAKYGPFDPTSWFWKQVPGTNYIDGVSGNLQIHHAADDNVVGIGYSRNLVNILQGSGINAQLFEYATGGHNLTGNSFTEAMGRSAEFLSN
jgi:hypothetical protein